MFLNFDSVLLAFFDRVRGHKNHVGRERPEECGRLLPDNAHRVSKSTPSMRSFTFFDTRSGSNAAVIPKVRAACSYALRVSPRKLKLFNPRAAPPAAVAHFNLYLFRWPGRQCASVCLRSSWLCIRPRLHVRAMKRVSRIDLQRRA